MTVSIRNIYIENFRSVRKLNISAKALTLLVGKNDSGKSNILRALNLFFNGETHHNKKFNFSDDFNLFYRPPATKAKEITIRLEFNIPDSYQEINGDYIVWEKKWRATGEVSHANMYWGIKLKKAKRGNKFKEQIIEIPDRSNLHSLLRKIQFVYVPAIKDALFFDELRGKIYAIISEAAYGTFKASSSSFEQSIGKHLNDLTKDISNSLGFETKLALPRDLSHIFERLEFQSGQAAVSLENRGDGIKARHIPLILKFMVEKKQSLAGRGASPYSIIWGYEEPENNLEMSSSIKLADDFLSYASEGVAQVLLTTHSPVFYNLKDKSKDEVIDYHVYKFKDDEGTKADVSPSDLDEKMGMVALMAPKMKELEESLKNRERAHYEAKKFIDSDRYKVFVEGESDKLIIKRALKLFAPDEFSNIDVETKVSGAGYSYVADMLIAWRSLHKHYPSKPKAAGVVDGDAMAIQVQKSWNKVSDNVLSAKCFRYEKPAHLHELLGAGFKVPVTLETLYPLHIWNYAEKNGHLTKRSLKDVLPEGLIEKCLQGGGQIDDDLDPDWDKYVLYDFSRDAKIVIAKAIHDSRDTNAIKYLANFEGLIGKITEYFNS